MPSRPSPGSTGAAALLAVLIATIPSIAQSLPPAQPTTQPTTPGHPQPAAPRRATVDYTAGKLSITAENSSLNQILRDIARLTGMTITGGVLDERVFGTYGPADTSAVLSALLNGTGSNMLLISNAGESPQQLILTPRQGGPTPPSPNTLRDPGESDLPPQLNPRTSRQFPQPPSQLTSPPTFNGALPAAPSLPVEPPAPATQSASPASQPANPTPAAPDTDTPAPPPANATTEQSPNGVKTPQQIYEQLIKLNQQQAKPPQQP